MKFLIPAAILTVIVLCFIIFRFVQKPKMAGGAGIEEPGESPIDFIVLFSSPLKLTDGSEWTSLMDCFRKQWRTSIICKEVNELSGPSKKMKQFILTDTIDHLHLTYEERPLDSELAQILINSNPLLSDDQKVLMVNSKAYIRVHYFTGESRNSVRRVDIALKTVICLLSQPESIGYSSIAGQFYHTKDYLEPLLQQKSLSNNDIMLAGTIMQFTQDDDDRMWIHTHGMEQFGVQDLQVKFDDESRTDYFYNLISNLALYLIDKGPVMKPGHTAELAGDGIIYRIGAVKDEDSHFGMYGALDIVPESAPKH